MTERGTQGSKFGFPNTAALLRGLTSDFDAHKDPPSEDPAATSTGPRGAYHHTDIVHRDGDRAPAIYVYVNVIHASQAHKAPNHFPRAHWTIILSA